MDPRDFASSALREVRHSPFAEAFPLFATLGSGLLQLLLPIVLDRTYHASSPMSQSRTPMASNANARKRPVETVDLTEDDFDEQPAHKRSSQASGVPDDRHNHSGFTHSQVAASQPTQSQRDSWLEEEDANDTIVLLASSQEGANGTEETEHYEIYGMCFCYFWLLYSKLVYCSVQAF